MVDIPGNIAKPNADFRKLLLLLTSRAVFMVVDCVRLEFIFAQPLRILEVIKEPRPNGASLRDLHARYCGNA